MTGSVKLYPYTVHGLCKSGFHDVCKLFEDWNLEANFCCACEKCNHPKLTIQQQREHELKVYGRVRWEENVDDGLDQTTTTDVASWFVNEDDVPPTDGHEEARKENETMSDTETLAPPQVNEEPVHEGEVTNEELDGSYVPEDADDTVEDTESEDDEDTPEVPTRGRGELESEVKEITDLFVAGKLKLPDDKELTPHYIALAIEKKFGYPEPPSTGAVAAVLKRWDDYGYATFGADPFHFTGLTDEGSERGLATLREETKERRKEERRKERESAKAAAEAEGDDSDEE